MASKRVRRVYSPEFKREAVRRMQEQGAAGTTLAQGSRALSVETYRYDPLGRRIRKEMIRDTALSVCTNHDKSSGCRNEVTRTVWDGANILYDVRMPADTATPTGGDGYPGAGTWTGSVGYSNADGVDAPLDLFKGFAVVVPYTTWRGTYDLGTCPTSKCTDADAYFPLQNATAFDDAAPPANGPPNWFGEVIGGQTDGSGYQYKRNRYYDARSGAFTQEDPIGLAGGLHAYGFANGNPISFDDPFGLIVKEHGSLLFHETIKTLRATDSTFNALYAALDADTTNTFLIFEDGTFDSGRTLGGDSNQGVVESMRSSTERFGFGVIKAYSRIGTAPGAVRMGCLLRHEIVHMKGYLGNGQSGVGKSDPDFASMESACGPQHADLLQP